MVSKLANHAVTDGEAIVPIEPISFHELGRATGTAVSSVIIDGCAVTARPYKIRALDAQPSENTTARAQRAPVG
jgi:hypothetical protein